MMLYKFYGWTDSLYASNQQSHSTTRQFGIENWVRKYIHKKKIKIWGNGVSHQIHEYRVPAMKRPHFPRYDNVMRKKGSAEDSNGNEQNGILSNHGHSSSFSTPSQNPPNRTQQIF